MKACKLSFNGNKYMVNAQGVIARLDQITLNPDPWNAWIYDPKHPDYHSKHAEYLRVARARAINNAPAWMLPKRI